MTYEEVLAPLIIIAAYILAGLAWNTLGIWQAWKEGKTAEQKIDGEKVKRNVVIGIILGVIAYGLTLAAPEGVTNAIVGIDSFILAVVSAFPAIVVADRIFNKKK